MEKIFQPIVSIFVVIFDAIHSFITSIGVTNVGLGYVLAVVLLTVIIKTLVLPFSIKSMKSTRKMQEFQPQVKKLQEKHKSDPQKANAEIMKLYKENNVSMTGGCLPMLIPLPILFALYWTFSTPDLMAKINHVSFLWIPNLAGNDPFYILPVLAGLSTFIPSWMMTKSQPSMGGTGGPNMMPMNLGMAVVMGVMSVRFPALLVIYWITSGVYQGVQTYFLNVIPMNKTKAKQEEAELISEESKNKFGLPTGNEAKNKKKKK